MKNLEKYRQQIQKAESGDLQAVSFLRFRIVAMTPEMPVDLLLSLSRQIARFKLNHQDDERLTE